MTEAEATPMKIRDNSQKFAKHQVGIIPHRMGTFRVFCYFRELSLICVKAYDF